MDFNEYQKVSRKTAIYPDKDKNFIYPAMGLVGEAGEVANKIQKVMRDHDSQMTEDYRQDLKKELGDVLWYLAQLATELDLNLDEIAQLNIEKLSTRQKKRKLSGSGDNR